MQQLEQLFDTASAIARGQIRWQRVGGKKQSITLKQRQMWARVAAYIAQVMNTISNGIDERQIDKDLDMLEKLVNEASEEAKAKERSDSEGEKASSVC
jgi:DNA-binding protein YbaB